MTTQLNLISGVKRLPSETESGRPTKIQKIGSVEEKADRVFKAGAMELSSNISNETSSLEGSSFSDKPISALSQLEKGTRLLKEKKYNEALEAFTVGLIDESEIAFAARAQLLVGQGNAAARLNKRDLAIDYYLLALEHMFACLPFENNQESQTRLLTTAVNLLGEECLRRNAKGDATRVLQACTKVSNVHGINDQEKAQLCRYASGACYLLTNYEGAIEHATNGLTVATGQIKTLLQNVLATASRELARLLIPADKKYHDRAVGLFERAIKAGVTPGFITGTKLEYAKVLYFINSEANKDKIVLLSTECLTSEEPAPRVDAMLFLIDIRVKKKAFQAAIELATSYYNTEKSNERKRLAFSLAQNYRFFANSLKTSNIDRVVSMYEESIKQEHDNASFKIETCLDLIDHLTEQDFVKNRIRIIEIYSLALGIAASDPERQIAIHISLGDILRETDPLKALQHYSIAAKGHIWCGDHYSKTGRLDQAKNLYNSGNELIKTVLEKGADALQNEFVEMRTAILGKSADIHVIDAVNAKNSTLRESGFQTAFSMYAAALTLGASLPSSEGFNRLLISIQNVEKASRLLYEKCSSRTIFHARRKLTSITH